MGYLKRVKGGGYLSIAGVYLGILVALFGSIPDLGPLNPPTRKSSAYISVPANKQSEGLLPCVNKVETPIRVSSSFCIPQLCTLLDYISQTSTEQMFTVAAELKAMVRT